MMTTLGRVSKSTLCVCLCLSMVICEVKAFTNKVKTHIYLNNSRSPLERKVDALSQTVDVLIQESKVKDLRIKSLEERVIELELGQLTKPLDDSKSMETLNKYNQFDRHKNSILNVSLDNELSVLQRGKDDYMTTGNGSVPTKEPSVIKSK